MSNSYTTQPRIAPLPGIVVLLLLLITGIAIYKDYGVSWDEFDQREIGRVNLEYIHTGNDALFTNYKEKDHGAAFEVFLKWVEIHSGAKELRDIVPQRHLCGFIFYLIGLGAGYGLALRIFRRQWLALAGLAMLAAMPRIFAHAFFNSKDVPFLAAMLIALYAVCAALQSRKLYAWALAGAACGLACGIRNMGALLPALTLSLLLAEIISGAAKKRMAWSLALFLSTTMLTLYASWPALWHHPIDNLVESFQNLSRFTRFKADVLFDGKLYAVGTLPLYYAPMWMGNSTPLLWLLLGVTGIGFLIVRIVKSPRLLLTDVPAKMLFICAGCFIIPLIAVMVLHSILYDDWRHLYFIYPPFVMLGLLAAERIAALRWRWLRIAVPAAIVIQAGCTAAFMVSAHPFQQVYFNALVPREPEFRRHFYDYEYWGTSYKQGLEWLLAHDTGSSIPVVNTYSPLSDNCLALPEAGSRRIRWTGEEDGSYLLTNFRFHPEGYPYPGIWGIVVGGSTVMQIYRVRK